MGVLDGKVAVITGAGGGIGKACVGVFVEEGAQVLAADISGSEKDTAAELGSVVVPCHADVSKEDEVVAMIDAALSAFGRLDAILNVAGPKTGRRRRCARAGRGGRLPGLRPLLVRERRDHPR